MKTLMFASDYSPNVGGVASHVYELAKAMHEAGHDTTIVTNVQANGAASARENLPRVLRVPERLRWMPLPKARRVQFMLNLLRPLLSELRDFDVVHFHTVDPLSRMLSRVWGGRPQIATNHTSMFVADAGDARRGIPWRQFFRRMDGVIAPSEELAHLTAAMTGDCERVRYVPNGVDASRFHPDVPGAECRARYDIRADDTVILCPRRLVRKNGCVFLARAVPAIVAAEPNARVVFVGEGPERENVAAALDAAGCLDRATFTGSIPNSEMPAVYAASDIVVVPSLVEATSISVLEAMAAARPVVVSRTGGLPALVEEGTTGYLVQPADDAGLAAAISRLLADPDRRAQLGEAARNRVLRQFTWDRIAALTVEAARGFLSRSRARSRNDHRVRLCPRSR